MKRVLNITNGDGAVEIMQAADIPGVFLPWRDILHDGPVPEGLSLEELSEVRAQFIFAQGFGQADEIKKDFLERDGLLKSFQDYEKIILWFEHDLYDQLQLLHILDWFSQQNLAEIKLSIICTEQYLGILSATEMIDLFQYEEPVTENHLTLANKAWSAFRSSTPERWQDLFNTDTSALPFLKYSIVRLLEEYPDCGNGLSRTEQQALKIISQGEKQPRKIFAQSQALEKRIFLGDAVFERRLNAFLESDFPLLETSDGGGLSMLPHSDQQLIMTATGKEVIDGQKSWLDLSKRDYWIGGVHLIADNICCWNSDLGVLVKTV